MVSASDKKPAAAGNQKIIAKESEPASPPAKAASLQVPLFMFAAGVTVGQAMADEQAQKPPPAHVHMTLGDDEPKPCTHDQEQDNDLDLGL